MSHKNSPNLSSSKSKHYTAMERKVFLQILDLFKHIIEIKKSDGTTMKEKEVAWKHICSRYNESALISQERTVQQLKKLWANIKQSQRDAITKEKQSRMATGGGPEQPEANIDPDVAFIAPHLITNAPVLFTSNMTDKEINDKRDNIFEFICTSDNVQFNDKDDSANIEDTESISNDIFTIQDTEQCDKKSTIVDKEHCDKLQDIVELSSSSNDKSMITKGCTIKGKKKKMTESNAEEIIRIKRIKQIIQQEQHLANIKSKQKMATLKEKHLIGINYLELKHLKEIHEEEIKIRKAKLKSIEVQQKENIEPDII